MNLRSPRTLTRRALPVVAAAALLVSAAGTLRAGDRLETWNSKTLPAGVPFSEAVRVGELVFLSGQIGILPGTRTLAPGGIREEARQTMENIRATLAAHGYGLDRLVRCTVMLADMAEWETFNEVYRTFFSGTFPARSAFGANGLALGARVEVECVAAVSEGAAAPIASAMPAPSPPVASAPSPGSTPMPDPAPVANPAPRPDPAPVASTAPQRPVASSPPASAPAGDDSWKLEEIRGHALLRGAEATLELSADGTASGKGPCNSFSASARISGERIEFGPFRATRRACSNGALNQLESDYLGALAKSVGLRRDGDNLELLAADGSVLLRFSKASAPSAP